MEISVGDLTLLAEGAKYYYRLISASTPVLTYFKCNRELIEFSVTVIHRNIDCNSEVYRHRTKSSCERDSRWLRATIIINVVWGPTSPGKRGPLSALIFRMKGQRQKGWPFSYNPVHSMKNLNRDRALRWSEHSCMVNGIVGGLDATFHGEIPN